MISFFTAGSWEKDTIFGQILSSFKIMIIFISWNQNKVSWCIIENYHREAFTNYVCIIWHFLTTYPPSLHFLCSKLLIFLTTYLPTPKCKPNLWKLPNFEGIEDLATVFLKWTDFRPNRKIEVVKEISVYSIFLSEWLFPTGRAGLVYFSSTLVVVALGSSRTHLTQIGRVLWFGRCSGIKSICRIVGVKTSPPQIFLIIHLIIQTKEVHSQTMPQSIFNFFFSKFINLWRIQGNLLWGIVNCLGVARSVVGLRYDMFFQIKFIKMHCCGWRNSILKCKKYIQNKESTVGWRTVSWVINWWWHVNRSRDRLSIFPFTFSALHSCLRQKGKQNATGSRVITP